MCACDRCRGRHWCESECPITVLNNDYGKCASLYVSRCWHMLSTTLNNLSHCAFSTSASRIKEHLKLGVRFRIGPPCTCWKWVLNTLQSCNPFCKRHRALAFFFFSPESLHHNKYCLRVCVRACSTISHAWMDHTPLFSKRVMLYLVLNLTG